ncbi:MAG: hypothetical protein PHW04_05600 [Candidatus Wallbacteria bacterium]|nr:hypothetical protein [Candidatus Wallbacteria bacterium]
MYKLYFSFLFFIFISLPLFAADDDEDIPNTDELNKSLQNITAGTSLDPDDVDPTKLSEAAKDSANLPDFSPEGLVSPDLMEGLLSRLNGSMAEFGGQVKTGDSDFLKKLMSSMGAYLKSSDGQEMFQSCNTSEVSQLIEKLNSGDSTEVQKLLSSINVNALKDLSSGDLESQKNTSETSETKLDNVTVNQTNIRQILEELYKPGSVHKKAGN